MEIEIRKPKIEDAKDIIKVNIETWKTTYRGIVTDEFLDSLSSDKPKLEKTIERIQDNNPYLIALVNGEIVGMLIYGKSRNIKYHESGEINAIYVLKQYQGLGIGKRLFLEAVKYLIEDNYDSMIIGCLVGNPSNTFYIKMGGKLVYQTELILDGAKYKENVYYFDNIKLL